VILVLAIDRAISRMRTLIALCRTMLNMDITNLDKHVAELRENGITIIEGYLETQMADDLCDQIIGSLESDEFASGDDYNGYHKMSNAVEPVANKRTGTDEGMIDIFNMDLVIDEIEAIKSDPQINDIIDRAADEEYVPTNINTYIRRSVTNPAPYHADSYSKFKSFVYLTDVPDQSYGPFSYVEGSHDVPVAEKFGTVFLNRLKGHSGAPRGIVPDPTVAKHATAPKGTLIISNQAGYHKGHTQAEDRERVLLTTAYSPKNDERDWVKTLARKSAHMLS